MEISTQATRNRISKEVASNYFQNDDGEPFKLTDKQAELFSAILYKDKNRVQVIAPTQWGKSDTIAMATIVRSQTYGEDFAIISGQQSKAEIIMQKVIKHVFDDDRLYDELELDANEPLERIKRERSKKRITWKCGGEIRTYTADARNKQAVDKSLTGFGARNIIEDEASLIDDDLQAMVMRMLGGHSDAFLLKIGNPFKRNHFLKSWRSDKYYKIFTDYHDALREGRYTEDFIEEMRGEPFFSVLYECKFPDEDELDIRGYRQLLKEEDLQFVDAVELGENLRLGVDVSEGGDNNVFVLRGDKGAKILSKNKSSDLMTQVNEVKRYKDEYKLESSRIFIDDTGVGAGVTDRLREIGIEVQAVKVGTSPQDKEKFTNIKAENYWNMAVWLKNGGKLERSQDWYELLSIKYKEDTGSSKLRCEPKDDMKKRGLHSPDHADALMLTFSTAYEPSIVFF